MRVARLNSKFLLLQQEVYGAAAELNALNGSDSETDEDDDEAHYDQHDDMESSEEETEKVTARVRIFSLIFPIFFFTSRSVRNYRLMVMLITLTMDTKGKTEQCINCKSKVSPWNYSSQIIAEQDQ